MKLLPALTVLTLLATIPTGAATYYVNVNNAVPVSPFTSWGTAAANIQDAVNVASAGDLVLVTNGIYQTGQTWTSGNSNRVSVTKAITLQSVNGPAATIIRGYQPGFPI
jgi:hypothetical protein